MIPMSVISLLSPLEAMAIFWPSTVDLVITDMQMPNMTGTQVLAKIRSSRQTIPVIVITAYSNVDNAIEVLRLGATDFVKKTFLILKSWKLPLAKP